MNIHITKDSHRLAGAEHARRRGSPSLCPWGGPRCYGMGPRAFLRVARAAFRTPTTTFVHEAVPYQECSPLRPSAPASRWRRCASLCSPPHGMLIYLSLSLSLSLSIYTYIYIYIRIRIHINMYIYIYIYTVYIYIYIYICIHVYTHTYICTYMTCEHMYVYIYIYIYMIYTRKHIVSIG